MRDCVWYSHRAEFDDLETEVGVFVMLPMICLGLKP